jgi:hypothetical protein
VETAAPEEEADPMMEAMDDETRKQMEKARRAQE